MNPRIAALGSALVVTLGSLYLALGTSTRFDTDPGPLAARVATLEEEARALAGLTEEVEDRLDGAIAEIREVLGRN